ncbi:MAG: methyltransferase [Nanoarchaeota archaeon]|nr:methyltransferase [Nanoarchaeota archaeon]
MRPDLIKFNEEKVINLSDDVLVNIHYGDENKLSLAIQIKNTMYTTEIINPEVLYGYVTKFLLSKNINPGHAKNSLKYRNFKVSWSESEPVWPPSLDSLFLIRGIETDLKLSNTDTRKYSLFDMGTGSGIIGVGLSKIMSFKHTYLCDINPDAIKKSNQTAILNGIDASSGSIEDLYIEKPMIIVANPPYFNISIRDNNKSVESGLESAILNLGGFNVNFYSAMKQIADDNADVVYFTTSSIAENELDFILEYSDKIDTLETPLSGLKDVIVNSYMLPDIHNVNLWRYKNG